MIQDGIGLVIHSGVNGAVIQQFLGGGHDVLDRHARLARDMLHVDAVARVAAALEEIVHASRLGRVSLIPRIVAAVVVAAVVDKHTIIIAIVVIMTRIPAGVGGPAAREVQVHVGGLEEVVVDLVEVADGLDDVRAHVPLVVVALEPAPDPHVVADAERARGRGRARLHLVRVDPELHLDYAGPVVQLVRRVRRLRADGPHHAHERHLLHVRAVDPERRVPREGGFAVDDLLDCYGPEGFVYDCLGKEFCVLVFHRGRVLSFWCACLPDFGHVSGITTRNVVDGWMDRIG